MSKRKAKDLNPDSLKKLKAIEEKGGITMRLLVSNVQVGAIIGKGGEHSRRLRDENNCFVSVLWGKDEKVRITEYKGTPEDVANALKQTCEFWGPDHESKTGSPYSLELLVHEGQVGSLIGQGGVLAKQLTQDTGAKLSVAKERKGESTEKVVHISGTLDAIRAATLWVMTQLNSNPLPANTPTVLYRPQTVAPTGPESTPYPHSPYYPPPTHYDPYGAPPPQPQPHYDPYNQNPYTTQTPPGYPPPPPGTTYAPYGTPVSQGPYGTPGGGPQPSQGPPAGPPGGYAPSPYDPTPAPGYGPAPVGNGAPTPGYAPNYPPQSSYVQPLSSSAYQRPSGGGGGGGDYSVKSVVKIDIPLNCIAGVIGRGGSVIQNIHRQTTASIKIAEQVGSEPHRVATITGSDAAVRSAAQMIQNRIGELSSLPHYQ